MRATLSGLLTVTLLALVPGVGRADDKDSAREIVEKAIKAHGGEDKLGKLQALTLKGKGVFHEQGQKLPFSGTWQTQGLDRSKSSSTLDVKGFKNTEIRVVNGDKGWIKSGSDETKELSKDELGEEKENLYFNYVTTLAPLKGKSFELSALGNSKVEGKEAVGIKVTSKNHREVKLYFDKETGMLVKAERPVKDVENNKMLTEEVTFSDYKEVDGIKVAMKYFVKQDGKPYSEAEMSEAKAEEKLDDKVFAKP